MYTHVYIDIDIDAYLNTPGPQAGDHAAALWSLASGEQSLSFVVYTYIRHGVTVRDGYGLG